MYFLVYFPENTVFKLEKIENIYQVPQIYDIFLVISILKECLPESANKLEKLQKLITIISYQFYLFEPRLVKFEGLEELLKDLCEILNSFCAQLNIENHAPLPSVAMLFHLSENAHSFKKLWKLQYQIESEKNLIDMNVLNEVKNFQKDFIPIVCSISTLIPLHFTKIFHK